MIVLRAVAVVVALAAALAFGDVLEKRFAKEFGWSGEERDAFDAAFVVGAARFAVEREMKAAKDDASGLDGALARGFPPGTRAASSLRWTWCGAAVRMVASKARSSTRPCIGRDWM